MVPKRSKLQKDQNLDTATKRDPKRGGKYPSRFPPVVSWSKGQYVLCRAKPTCRPKRGGLAHACVWAPLPDPECIAGVRVLCRNQQRLRIQSHVGLQSDGRRVGYLSVIV